MVKSQGVFTWKFKLAAVRESRVWQAARLCARQLEVNPNTLHRWRREFKEQPMKAFPVMASACWVRPARLKLERKVGQLTMENDFLRGLWRSFEQQQVVGNGGGPSTQKLRADEKTHGMTACFTFLPTFLPVRAVPLPTPLPKPPIPLPNSFPPFTGLPRDMFLPKRLPPRPALLPPYLYA